MLTVIIITGKRYSDDGERGERLRSRIYGTCGWVVHKHFPFIFTAITFMAIQWSMELKAHSHSKQLLPQAFRDNSRRRPVV